MRLSYRIVRRKLIGWGLFPRRTLARVTTYLVALDLLLIVVSRVSAALKFRAGSDLGGWVGVLSFVAVLLSLVLALRWVRRQLMWRLRNRLIVTYVFIGVIPVVLLLAMAAIASFMFAGQFAFFLATSDLESEMRAVQSSNSGMAAGLAARLRRGEAASPESLQSFAASERMFPSREVTAWFRGKALVAPPGARPLSLPPVHEDDFRAVALEQGRLYFRAARTLPVGADQLTVISSIPLTPEMLAAVTGRVGEVTLAKAVSVRGQPGTQVPAGALGGSTNPAELVPTGDAELTVKAGAVPPQRNRLDYSVLFLGPLSIVHWNTAQKDSVVMMITTRPSLLYARLAASFGENASKFISALIGIAIALAIVELLALVIGIRLTRTMTRSVAELYSATQRVNRGDFRHRIPVQTQDQLAALETSFNSMTESLEKLLAEQKEKQRMENELAIAHEVQSQLFPHQVSELRALEVHGLCRPARTVSGDYYDFLPLGPEKLALAVGDISGKGISAALLMATIHSAVRAYTLERVPALAAATAGGNPAMLGTVPFATKEGELSPATLMAMLNRQLYRSTPAEKYATLWLGIYDGRARQLTYCNAGHLPPIIFGRDGALRRLDCGGTVIGLFGGLTYEEAQIELRPGEMLLAYSDGVTEPENEFGEFGEPRLVELVRQNRDLPLARISEAVIAAVDDWIGGGEQPDDVTLVLARAR